jgi:hypothetical protein
MAIEWKELKTYGISDREVSALWIAVLDTFEGQTHLQITAEGRWTAMGGSLAECGPDGLAGVPLIPERLIVADCPVGALIGKIGGSSAAATTAAAVPANPPSIDDGKAFAIGSHCLTSVPEKSIGPLFVGFNCLARPVKVVRLKVVVSGATVPT